MFEPRGGFPPIRPKRIDAEKKKLFTVSISQIVDSIKQENLDDHKKNFEKNFLNV